MPHPPRIKINLCFFWGKAGAWFLDKVNYANRFPGRHFIIIIFLKRRNFIAKTNRNYKQKLQPSLIQDNASKT